MVSRIVALVSVLLGLVFSIAANAARAAEPVTAPCDPNVPGQACAADELSAAPKAPAPSAESAGTLAIRAEDLPVEAIERIVHDYLLKNPEVLREAYQVLQAKEQAEQEARDQVAIAQHAEALFNDPDAMVGGNAEGAITIVEFFDYRCGHCRRVSPAVEQVLATNADVKIIYKEFPILGEGSVLGAQAALAARAQGRYHELHGALMRAEGGFDRAHILAVAAEAGLDATRLAADMDAPALNDVLRRNHRLARDLGIKGTPAFIIGGRVVRGALELEQLQAMIAEVRASKADMKANNTP